MRILSMAIMLFSAVATLAQAVPQSVTPQEADSHLVKRVEPALSDSLKAIKAPGPVKLQITISASGDVVSVKLVGGNPLFLSVAMQAVKQWKYKPFEVNGKPLAVSSTVEVHFPGEATANEQALRDQSIHLEEQCRALISQAQYTEAEAKCREAVAVSQRLPSDIVLEKSSAQTQLGHAIFLQKRYAEAIPYYEAALKLDQGYREPDDADLASDYENLGRAYAFHGQLSQADGLYSSAVSTFEAAIAGLPGMKDNYTRRLKRTLNEYAQLKELEGDNTAAAALRKKAEGL